MEDILIVGQTPPPVNGQTAMIQSILQGTYANVRLHHVRMTFSRSIDEVGTFTLRKLVVLLMCVCQIIRARFRTKASVLYYPPAGPAIVPVIRDIAVLLSIRWMFRYTVLHFHAAGLTEIYPRLPMVVKPFYKLAYRDADLAIVTARSRVSLGLDLNAKGVTVIPYGIEDLATTSSLDRANHRGCIPTILFMGILCDGKGLFTLIDACALLLKTECLFRVVCAGTYDSDTSARQVNEMLDFHGLSRHFTFPGVMTGQNKDDTFRAADIFCFPSHYYAESSPIVLVEAMSYQLPIVTTQWRGIPEVIGDSRGAFLVEPKRPDLVAERLCILLKDESLRVEMGRRNRAWFSQHGTVDRYRNAIEAALLGVCTLATDAVAADCATS